MKKRLTAQENVVIYGTAERLVKEATGGSTLTPSLTDALVMLLKATPGDVTIATKMCQQIEKGLPTVEQPELRYATIKAIIGLLR